MSLPEENTEQAEDDAGLDRDVSAINQFYADRMAKLGVPFIDTAPIA